MPQEDTIDTLITGIATSKSNIASAIEGKGVTVPSGTKLAGMASLINSIQTMSPTVVAPAYSSSSTYTVGQKVTYEGQLYECNTAITTAEEWTAAHWTAITVSGTFVDLDTAQTITGDKTFAGSKAKFKFSSADTNSYNILGGSIGDLTTDVLNIKNNTSGYWYFSLSDSAGDITNSPHAYTLFSMQGSQPLHLYTNRGNSNDTYKSYLEFPEGKGTSSTYDTIACLSDISGKADDSDVIHKGTSSTPASSETRYGDLTLENDLYINSYINFKDSTNTNTRIWRWGEGQWGTVELETSSNSGTTWNGRYSFQTGAFCPTTDTITLGTSSSSQRWSTFYYSGALNHTNYTVNWNNGIEFKNTSNQTLFYIGSDKSMWFYGKLTPSGTPDIGDSTHTVNNVFMSGVFNKNSSNYGLALPSTTSYTANKTIATTDDLSNYVTTTNVAQDILGVKTIKDTSLNFGISTSGSPFFSIEENQDGQLDLSRTYNGSKTRMLRVDSSTISITNATLSGTIANMSSSMTTPTISGSKSGTGTDVNATYTYQLDGEELSLSRTNSNVTVGTTYGYGGITNNFAGTDYTVTLPLASGEILVSGGNQSITGNKTFSNNCLRIQTPRTTPGYLYFSVAANENESPYQTAISFYDSSEYPVFLTNLNTLESQNIKCNNLATGDPDSPEVTTNGFKINNQASGYSNYITLNFSGNYINFRNSATILGGYSFAINENYPKLLYNWNKTYNFPEISTNTSCTLGLQVNITDLRGV